jgi:mRNA-degrading endonuclease RelE of RelBE toxin-antitoxin system
MVMEKKIPNQEIYTLWLVDIQRIKINGYRISFRFKSTQPLIGFFSQ